MDSGLLPSQLEGVTILERVCSGFSLFGSMVVIATFCFSKAFHKPINRLVFYATFGNLMTNVATLMARSFIEDQHSPGCQFQAFLIQMFMPADAFWTLAMAVNVYLTFYFKFDAQRLRRMEIPYFLLCYGIPFIVALVLIFVSTPEKGRMYGDATLWCWIAPEWDIFRIAIFYGPVWIVIIVTFLIYIRAGREIYKKQKQLRDFSLSTSRHEPETLPPIDDPFSSTKVTEVYVTTEVIDKNGAIDLAPLGGSASDRRKSQPSASPQKPAKAAYSVTISSNRPEGGPSEMEGQVQTTITADPRATTAGGTGLARTTTNTNTSKVVSSGAGTHSGTGNGNNHLRRRAAYEANNATWSYAKCAILFFTAMLVTWLPSSANRVYSVIHPGGASLALEYMSSFVLPLQGFWNAIIYIVTSWAACKMVWDDIKSWWSCTTSSSHRRRRANSRGLPGSHDLMPGGGGKVGLHMHRSAFQMMGGSKSNDSKAYETESMTELAGSRPGSSGHSGTSTTK